MAIRVISLTNEVNISAQIGDTIWITQLKNAQSGLNHPSASSSKKMTKFGVITNVDQINNMIEYEETEAMSDIDLNQILSSEENYFFFSKNQSVNTSGISGYYASVEYRNYSKKEAEIFATGTNYAPSSK